MMNENRGKSIIKVAIIGVGNMGSNYASMLQEDLVPQMELAALTRVSKARRAKLAPALSKGIPVYESADELFTAVESGELALDAVIITTPHYDHEVQAVRAFKAGLHVLCDKPAGAYSRQSRNMEEAAVESSKVFGLVFNQRTLPIYKKMKELVDSGVYGSLKRVNWVVTDWYRPAKYFQASSWHSTWATDGGGVVLNQCSHNLDLLQWICGMPTKVQAFCHEGRFHAMEVEDDVTAYLEWSNGANGTFITSTGDAPGLNRLEISLEEAMLVCENGKLRIGETGPEMGCSEKEYMAKSTDFFRPIRGTWTEWEPEEIENQYVQVLKAFAEECLGVGACVAPGAEGRKSLLITNAMYLSSWEKRMVDIPEIGSAEELQFEAVYEEMLRKKSTHLEQ